MKIAIGSTRAGLRLKDQLMAWLQANGHLCVDVGMKEGGDFVPYYEAAAQVAQCVAAGDCPKGIAICGTGAGSVIVANKFKDVYAVHVSSQYEASKASAVNGANVIVFGEWITPCEHALECLQTWLNTEFGAGFTPEWKQFLQDSCGKIKEIENKNFL